MRIKLVSNITTEYVNKIRLIRSENIGPVTFYNMLQVYGSATDAIEALPEIAKRGGRKKPVRIASEADTMAEIDKCQKFGAEIITIDDPDFPTLLKHIHDCPPVLTIFGQKKILNDNIISIVGSRNSSANGCRFAEGLAKSLGRSNIIIASGLARGIDTAAHKGSLATRTIAAVAGGIDKIYPPENRDLFTRIAEQGAVIAEMPFGSLPKAQNFPRRNRIISGIALGTIIIEASLNSGSLITARMAIEHDREVFAVPGSPLDPRCKGTNKLIKEGAHMVEGPSDVLSQLDGIIRKRDLLLSDRIVDFKAPSTKSLSGDEISDATPYILEKIGCSPTNIDDIIYQTGISANTVLAVMLDLEISGRLTRHHGNKVSLLFATEDMFEGI